jgi:isoprenylcysteine carboxyl methyltransferase (ICMT) family protein YpbQ
MPTALVGLAATIAALILLGPLEAPLFLKVVLLVAAVAAAMIAIDVGWFRTFRNPTTGLSSSARNTFSLDRLARKLIGLAVTFGTIYCTYSFLPEYAGSFYNPAWAAARITAPFFIVAGVAYILFVDARQTEPEDAYAQLGALVTGRSWPADWTALAQHARGWLVKAFFLPLMFVYLTGNLEVMWRTDFAQLSDFDGFYEFAYNLLFILDLLFAAVGYTFTFRLIDTHIRSAEPTMTGWVVCLVCYQPFWSLIEAQYLRHERDQLYWGDALAGHTTVHWVWGSAILLFLTIYALATVVFGLRFSNLTHRGIITTGPYRWTKHPAYISKCISFWLISVPFLATGTGSAIVQCLFLLAVNGIYFLRARTEERHLARDPEYRQYQDFIRAHGLAALCSRLFYAQRRREG